MSPVQAGHRPRKSERITRSGDFDRVYREGRSFASHCLVMYVFMRVTEQGAGKLAEVDRRLGVSVNRKVGGAVERSRIKRLLRESFANLRGRFPEGYDVVLVARPPLVDVAVGGERAVREAVNEVVEKMLTTGT